MNNFIWKPDQQKGIRIPGAACERCQAFELLKAHAPETFMDWLERTESSQRGSLPPGHLHRGKAAVREAGAAPVERVPLVHPGVGEDRRGFSIPLAQPCR